MRRLNAGAWAAGIAIFGTVLVAAIGLKIRSNSEGLEAQRAAYEAEARDFGLKCPESRSPGECEALCRSIYATHAAWSECVRAVVDPRLVGAEPRPDPAPELEGGPFPDECEGLAPGTCGGGPSLKDLKREAAFRECMGGDRPRSECEAARDGVQ